MIDLANESGAQLDEKQLLALAAFALRELRIHPQSELSIVLMDPDTMASYHQQYLQLPGPTDVMSFPMDEMRLGDSDDEPPLGLLGDIVLCPQVITAQAPENGRSPDEEAQYLLIHGLLHLLGFDHDNAEDKVVMFSLNDRLIAAWQGAK